MVHQQAYRAADGGKHRAYKSTVARTMMRRLPLAAAVLFAASLSSAPGHAQSGPFAQLAGNWSGGGTVSLEDGSTERIRCRAKYAPYGPAMEMTLTCASDAYKFILSANVQAAGTAITGTWSEASRNISGTLQGRGGGGNFQLVASNVGANFNANIALRTSGNKQSVSMRADSQFRGASISMSR